MQAQFPEVLIALDFFHIPEKLWPTAVKVYPSVKASFDDATATAHRLVNDILEGGFEGASLNDAGVLKKGKYALCRSDAGVLKLQQSDSEEEFFSTRNKMVIDSMLSAVLHNVAATNGLKLDICCIDGLSMTYVKVQIFAVAD